MVIDIDAPALILPWSDVRILEAFPAYPPIIGPPNSVERTHVRVCTTQHHGGTTHVADVVCLAVSRTAFCIAQVVDGTLCTSRE